MPSSRARVVLGIVVVAEVEDDGVFAVKYGLQPVRRGRPVRPPQHCEHVRRRLLLRLLLPQHTPLARPELHLDSDLCGEGLVELGHLHDLLASGVGVIGHLPRLGHPRFLEQHLRLFEVVLGDIVLTRAPHRLRYAGLGHLPVATVNVVGDRGVIHDVGQALAKHLVVGRRFSDVDHQGDVEPAIEHSDPERGVTFEFMEQIGRRGGDHHVSFPSAQHLYLRRDFGYQPVDHPVELFAGPAPPVVIELFQHHLLGLFPLRHPVRSGAHRVSFHEPVRAPLQGGR